MVSVVVGPAFPLWSFHRMKTLNLEHLIVSMFLLSTLVFIYSDAVICLQPCRALLMV